MTHNRALCRAPAHLVSRAALGGRGHISLMEGPFARGKGHQVLDGSARSSQGVVRWLADLPLGGSFLYILALVLGLLIGAVIVPLWLG
jgi:hypothetical protein